MSHEEELVKAFILPVRQERYLEFLKSPKKRAKFIAQLAHFKHLNPKFVVSIPGNQQDSTARGRPWGLQRHREWLVEARQLPIAGRDPTIEINLGD